MRKVKSQKNKGFKKVVGQTCFSLLIESYLRLKQIS